MFSYKETSECFKTHSLRVLWHCETLELSWGCVTVQTCSDEVRVYHLSLCVNILLGSSPSISSGMTTFSPLCLPAGYRVHKFYSDKSSDQVMHCTQYDSQRCLLNGPFNSSWGPWLKRNCQLWLAPASAVCCRESVWFGRPGFLWASQEATCADGSQTKGWPPVMLSGPF